MSYAKSDAATPIFDSIRIRIIERQPAAMSPIGSHRKYSCSLWLGCSIYYRLYGVINDKTILMHIRTRCCNVFIMCVRCSSCYDKSTIECMNVCGKERESESASRTSISMCVCMMACLLKTCGKLGIPSNNSCQIFERVHCSSTKQFFLCCLETTNTSVNHELFFF